MERRREAGDAAAIAMPPVSRWPARLERRGGDRRTRSRRAADAQSSLATDRLVGELERERQLRTQAEATAKLLAKLVAEENGRRREAEAHAQITFAELSLATSVSRRRPSRARKRRTPAALLRRLTRRD